MEEEEGGEWDRKEREWREVREAGEGEMKQGARVDGEAERERAEVQGQMGKRRERGSGAGMY